HMPLDIGHELHHVLRGDHAAGHGRAQRPGDDHAADEEHTGDRNPGDRVGPRPEDLQLEEHDDDGRVDDAQERDPAATSFPAGRSRPSGVDSLSGGPAAAGLRKAQMRASGQSMPPVARPSQPATVMAAACGWPRFWAIWPGSDPSVTTMTTAAAR